MSHPALGRFVWYDLMTTDPAGAKAFYNQLIGWGTKLWDDGDMPYTMWTNGPEPIGGVMDLAEGGQRCRGAAALARLCCGDRCRRDL